MKNNFAYITDSGIGSTTIRGGLIVYNFATNTARRVLDSVVSTQPDFDLWFSINGEKVLNNNPMQTGAGNYFENFHIIFIFLLKLFILDGIALTPSTETLYYCPLTGRTLYSIPTSLLRNFSISDQELNDSVVVVMVTLYH